MAYITLVTFINDGDDEFGRENDGLEYVSHGVHSETCEMVVLPNERPHVMGAKWNGDVGYHLPIPTN